MDNNATFEEIVELVTAAGFEVNVGRHMLGLSGYYAVVYREAEADWESADYEPHKLQDWDRAGHGATLAGALREAIAIVSGDQKKTYFHALDFGAPYGL